MARGLLGRNNNLHIRQRRRDVLKEADLVILAGEVINVGCDVICDVILDKRRHSLVTEPSPILTSLCHRVTNIFNQHQLYTLHIVITIQLFHFPSDCPILSGYKRFNTGVRVGGGVLAFLVANKSYLQANYMYSE